jgi:hypothetical protein
MGRHFQHALPNLTRKKKMNERSPSAAIHIHQGYEESATHLPSRIDSFAPITRQRQLYRSAEVEISLRRRPTSSTLSPRNGAKLCQRLLSKRQDLNPSPIWREAIASLAVVSTAKCAPLRMRCVLDSSNGSMWHGMTRICERRSRPGTGRRRRYARRCSR